MLTFSNPFLFWLLPALALPWIFRRRKEERIQHVRFPLLQFLRESEEKELVNPHLQELLLLILRTLLIALLLFALAGPKWVTGTLPGNAVFSWLPIGKAFQRNTLVLDTSYSMGYGEGTTSTWRKAQEAWKLVDTELKGFSTSYLQWDQGTVATGHLAAKSSQNIEALFLGNPDREGTSLVEFIETLKNSTDEIPRIVLITDGQKWPWTALLNREINPRQVPSMLILPVGDTPVTNHWFNVKSLSMPPWGIAGWETIAGHVLTIHPDKTIPGTISIFHGKTGNHLYSKPVTFPASPDQPAELPFSFTALLSKLVHDEQTNHAGQVTFTLRLEPSDPLPIDNQMTLQVPLVQDFSYGLAYNPQSSNQARDIFMTAINPLVDTEDAPPVEILPLTPGFQQIAPQIDLAFLVQNFAPGWSNQEQMATMEYIKNGGSVFVATGDKNQANADWTAFLEQLGWAWHAPAEESAPVDLQSITIAGSDLYSNALKAWEPAMWSAWLTETNHGQLNAPNTKPRIAYDWNGQTAHLLSEISIGKGRCWIMNTAMTEKSGTLLSPILPVLIWETAKETARSDSDQDIQIPKPKRESNLAMLTQEEKQQISEHYPIQFATIQTVEEEIQGMQTGIDLRIFLIFSCLILALIESWLSNRLASM